MEIARLEAAAAERLSPAAWAFLDVTARNVKFPLEDRAVVAGVTGRLPVHRLFAISDASIVLVPDSVGQGLLRRSDLLGPSLDNPNIPVGDHLWRQFCLLKARYQEYLAKNAST